MSKEGFGVQDDGIHDDTNGIQEAINIVKNKYSFGIVLIPEGSYRITDTIYVPRAIRLIGYGKNRPKIIQYLQNKENHRRLSMLEVDLIM